MRYLESGQHLVDENLESVAEFFDNIFNLQVADSSLTKKHERHIEYHAKCELRHTLEKCYKEKLQDYAKHH